MNYIILLLTGQINDWKCTHSHKKKEPLKYGWLDNFLCVPSNSPFNFHWSSRGPIKGEQCIQWREPLDPHSWDNNYLCM